MSTDPLLGPNGTSSYPSSETPKDMSVDYFGPFAKKGAIASEVGLLLVVSSIAYGLLTNPIILFTGHPSFNSLGLVLLSLGTIFTQRPARNPTEKLALGRYHGILNGLGATSFLIGGFTIWYNKHSHNAAHYTTWHAIFGLATYIGLFSAALFGVAQFWFPILVFGSEGKAKSFYKYHRAFGYLVIASVGFTILLALDSDFNQAALHIPYLTVVPGLVLLLGGLASQVDVRKLPSL